MNPSENDILAKLVTKCRQAHLGQLAALSHGEQLAVALTLNRADWLADADTTMAQAIDRVGPNWLAVIPQAARVLEDEGL